MSEKVQYQMELTVTPEVIDEQGHMNNAAFIAFVEVVARAHASAMGLTTAALQRWGGAFVVRRHEATYFGEAKEGDCLTLQTWVEAFIGPRCARIVQILRAGQTIFESRTDWVWIDVNSRMPRRIPPQIQQALAAVST